jgi:hypothetical protein
MSLYHHTGGSGAVLLVHDAFYIYTCYKYIKPLDLIYEQEESRRFKGAIPSSITIISERRKVSRLALEIGAIEDGRSPQWHIVHCCRDKSGRPIRYFVKDGDIRHVR